MDKITEKTIAAIVSAVLALISAPWAPAQDTDSLAVPEGYMLADSVVAGAGGSFAGLTKEELLKVLGE